MKDVSGKIGFITGGASGLGFAMAKTFLASGMRVALTDIEDAAIERTKAFFSDRDADVLVMKTDVTDRDSLGAAGVHEAIYTLLMLEHDFITGSANIFNKDPDIDDAPIVMKREDEANLVTVMSNSFGFGGTNAVLVFRKV